MPTLLVSIVTFNPDSALVGQTLRTLVAAASAARRAGALASVELVLIDNGPTPAAHETLTRLVEGCHLPTDITARILSGHGNVGYGAGHNLAIATTATEFHLILNPDVLLEPDAIIQALAFMHGHPDIGLLSPRVVGEDGALQYLCKRYPTPLVLGLRGLAPGFVRAAFASTLERYEMRDALGEDRVVFDVPIATGAFMFCRSSALRAIGGFDPGFFLYFEDFDLSLRMATVARLAYVPSVRIVHLGGYSARKGFAHIRMFAASGVRFFRKHGWRRAAPA